MSIFAVDPRRRRRRDKNLQPLAAPRPLLIAVSPTLCTSSSAGEGTFGAGDPRAELRPGPALRRRLFRL